MGVVVGCSPRARSQAYEELKNLDSHIGEATDFSSLAVAPDSDTEEAPADGPPLSLDD